MDKIIDIAKNGADRYQESQLSMLEELCNIDSGSKNIKGNKKVVKIIENALSEMGAEVTQVESPGYGIHIIARIKPEHIEGKVILAAHLDTVFKEGDAFAHPFRIENEYAYGLGAADCKGGVVTILYAIRILKEANLLPNKELVIILNCDEEIGSPTSQELFKSEAMDAEAVLSFEPGRKKNGILTNRYGVVEGTIKINGESAHACMDGEPGANAVLELANLILKLDQKENENLGIHYNVAPISGGVGPSVVADYAEANFWVTVASEEAYEQVKKDMENLSGEGIVNGCEISTAIDLKFPPMERSESNVELYHKICKAASLIGMDLPEEMSKSPADCNFYSALEVPTVDGLGPYMYNIHTVNEHILVSSLRERTKLVSLILAQL
ncbi:M20/M25/M40 family metallo-hydrolase [Oceanobacillus sp. FSL K6-2867]|uniref:M20/M25/M40 family metallo-hydrolase n=1 Tax=Oceanobacillus sp. FSL K6-2867 TaxID=2954748 RepID=UPI0030DBED16